KLSHVLVVPFLFFFFFYSSVDHRDLHSFPTRRSSDLPKATSSTLYFDSLTVNAGNGGFLHCIQMDTSVNAANQVVSVDRCIHLKDRKSGSAGMPRPISYAVFCLKKKKKKLNHDHCPSI